jgi:hypothetical protein
MVFRMALRQSPIALSEASVTQKTLQIHEQKADL